jgi:hypothetical protein
MDVEELIPHLNVSGTVGTENIADIITIAQEGVWLKEEEELQKKFGELSEENTKIDAEIKKGIEKLVEEISKKIENDLQEVTRKYGLKVSVILSANYGPLEPKGIRVRIRGINISSRKKDDLLRVVKSKEMQGMIKTKADITEKTVKVSKELNDVKRNLGNIERLRRLARAKVGVELLKKSSEGRALLKNLGLLGVDRLLPNPDNK